MEEGKKSDIVEFPLLPLRGTVLFPGILLSFDIGREKSLAAVDNAMRGNQTIFIVPQKDNSNSDPNIDDFNCVGVVARIKNQLFQTGNIIRITAEGMYRAKVNKVVREKPFFKVQVFSVDEETEKYSEEYSILINMVKKVFNQTISLSSDVPNDLIIKIEEETNPNRLVDMISYYFIRDNHQKLNLLSEESTKKRLEKLIGILLKEVDLAFLKTDLVDKLKESVNEDNRKYYLRQQLKIIMEELGEGSSSKSDSDDLKSKILKLDLEKSTKEKLLKECSRLSNMPYDFQEANIVKNYLDTCVSLPWNKSTKNAINIEKAQRTLDRGHYGLKKVKEKIIELLAVKSISGDNDGQIICLVGPPGVGKTSIAKSIAKAVGKKYIRISLGGVRDEANIRGHRKTYIGAMPGRIISAINQVGVNNPLILLDEIDKLGRDVFGDPTSAMLEVLDPEQNNTFVDHYLDIPFNLSKVLFVVTANEYDEIPAPLLDRMDVVRIEGYTQEEKYNIAQKYLIPKSLKKSGLNSRNLKLTDEAIRILIDGYTREAGVRGLERKILSICRKTAKILLSEEKTKVLVDKNILEEMLGPKKYRRDLINKSDEVGVARGLAWTSMGGETMPIEVAILKGNGKVHLTGSLGNVMKESADIAISCVRSMAKDLGIKQNFYRKNDIHIHVPEGAVPKDGPSAGITLATSVISALMGIPVKHDVAMTGEITLRGRVLPIGGLKEKTMAAYITGVSDVIIPMENKADLSEIDDTVKSKINFIFAEDINTVISNALVDFKKERENNAEESDG